MANALDIAQYLPTIQVFGQIALIAGATFAGYQFLLHRKEVAEAAALRVLSQFQDGEFRAAYTKVWDLPLDATADNVRGAGKEMEDAVECVAMMFESVGVMVHNRIVPIELVDQVIGGFLRESWRRTRSYIEWKRQDVNSKRVGEWYQWLAERLAVDHRRSQGAYVAFKDWKP